jgi:hydrogenase expression/formation protein HypC
MCLAIPGKVVSLHEDVVTGVKMAKVSFGGVIKTVCMEHVPQTIPGDYVLVHVGYALTRVDEQEAERTFQLLRELDQLSELDAPEEKVGGES